MVRKVQPAFEQSKEYIPFELTPYMFPFCTDASHCARLHRVRSMRRRLPGQVSMSTQRSWRGSMWERMVVISGLRSPFREDILGNTGSLFSFRTPNSSNDIPFVTWPLNDPNFDDAGDFSDDDCF